MNSLLLIPIFVMVMVSTAIARETPSKVEQEISDSDKLPDVKLTDPMNRDVNPAMPDRTGTSTDTIGLGPPAVKTSPSRPTSDQDAINH